MFVSLLSGVITGVMGNAISDTLNENEIEKIQFCYEKAEKDFYKKYGNKYGNNLDSFLTREENVQLAINSILRNEEEYDLRNMNPESFNGYDSGTVEAIFQFGDFFKNYIMEDLQLAHYVYQNEHYRDQKEIIALLNKINHQLNSDNITSDKVEYKIVELFVDELFTVIRVFKDAFNIELFSENCYIKESQLKAVKNDQTSFLCAISYIFNLVEKLNYLEFNKLSTVNETNKIKSLEYVLKKYYHEDSFKIDSFISRKLENIQYLMNGYRGIKCANFYQALNELELDTTQSYISIWEGMLKILVEVFITISSIVIKNITSTSDEQFQRLTKEKIKSSISRSLTWTIEDDNTTVEYLKYLLDNGGKAIDTEIASHFSRDVGEIRKALYPLLGNIILYNFNTLESTKVFILNEVKELVEEVINYAN